MHAAGWRCFVRHLVLLQAAMQAVVGTSVKPLPFSLYSDASMTVTIGEGYTFHPLSIFTPCGDSKGFRSRYAMRTIAMLPVINFRQLCLPLDMQKPDRCVRDLYAWGLSILPSRSQLASNCACL